MKSVNSKNGIVPTLPTCRIVYKTYADLDITLDRTNFEIRNLELATDRLQKANTYTYNEYRFANDQTEMCPGEKTLHNATKYNKSLRKCKICSLRKQSEEVKKPSLVLDSIRYSQRKLRCQ